MLHKARHIADLMNILQEGFTCDWGWYKNFKKRKGLGCVLLHGEGAEVDKENLETLAALEELYNIAIKYNIAHIYNMDEIGLFFR